MKRNAGIMEDMLRTIKVERKLENALPMIRKHMEKATPGEKK